MSNIREIQVLYKYLRIIFLIKSLVINIYIICLTWTFYDLRIKYLEYSQCVTRVTFKYNYKHQTIGGRPPPIKVVFFISYLRGEIRVKNAHGPHRWTRLSVNNPLKKSIGTNIAQTWQGWAH